MRRCTVQSAWLFLAVVVYHLPQVPVAIRTIVSEAFAPKAAAGGFVGVLGWGNGAERSAGLMRQRNRAGGHGDRSLSSAD